VKQDCKRNAAKRGLARHGAAVTYLRPVFLGDDLFACQPIVAAIQAASGSFILTCKPPSPRRVCPWRRSARTSPNRLQTRQAHHHDLPLARRGTAARHRRCITGNWFSVEILNGKGKRTYHNSFVTDLAITPDTVADLAACGRAHWKIENETFNVLKTNRYNLKHNFGHGKETLANVLVTA
jgi:hypothetical protein